MKSLKNILLVSLFFLAVSAAVAVEMDAQDKADAAVASILFDYEGAESFATYVVRDNGYVNISFARNMPDTLYSEVLAKLKGHPDITGVLAGKSGPVCRMW